MRGLAIERTNPVIACLVVTYSAAEKFPEKPAREEVIRITPFLFFFRSARIAILESLRGWLILMSTEA
jgi:hypothetical protein